jgi:hypothetical protein
VLGNVRARLVWPASKSWNALFEDEITHLENAGTRTIESMNPRRGVGGVRESAIINSFPEFCLRHTSSLACHSGRHTICLVVGWWHLLLVDSIKGMVYQMLQLEPVVHSSFIAPYENRIWAIFHKL